MRSTWCTRTKKSDHNIVVVNTCGFIDKAKEESVNTILHQVELKKKGRLDKVFVTGCLSQRYRDDLEKEIPEVDAWFGTLELPLLLRQFEADYKAELLGERLLATPKHYAYLKISEGCNRTCAFCAIPLMRGGHISRPIEDLVKEAEGLVRKGVKEVMLIAQELTYYGLDLYKRRGAPGSAPPPRRYPWPPLDPAYSTTPTQAQIPSWRDPGRHARPAQYLQLPRHATPTRQRPDADCHASSAHPAGHDDPHPRDPGESPGHLSADKP